MSPPVERYNLSALALRHRTLTLFAILVVAAAGIWAYMHLGDAEDPPFTIKQMVVQANWPGASADEVTRSLTDRIERKLEELPFLDNTTSNTVPGATTIFVSLRDDTPPSAVPGLWYQVRKKLADLAPSLPQGVQGPYFNDEFGDVFGIIYAMTGDGFSLPQLRHVAEDTREELLGVPGVAKVQLVGDQQEAIYVDVSFKRLAEFGITVQDIATAVQRENIVADDAFVETPQDRIYLRTRNAVSGPDELARLPVQAHGRLIPLGDLASFHRGITEPPTATMHANGRPAIGLMISMQDGGNILDLGRRVHAAVQRISASLPLGVQLTQVNDQANVVAQDVGDFQESFLEALGIVLLVSFLSLGWRTGIVVAISVPLVLAGVMVGMKLLGIDLQRISLGAMIIALGLLVDDAIIAVETMVVKLEQGWDRIRAGSFAYTSTAFPMLSGTLVTAAGYLPVGLAQSAVGEYTRDIFRVVGMALVLSWLVAVIFVPYLGAMLLPKPRHVTPADGERNVYDTRVYNRLRRMVGWCVQHRKKVLAITVLAFIAAVVGFTKVPSQFFPDSDRLEVLIDMRLPEGSSFAATDAAVRRMRGVLDRSDEIASYAAYTGSGAPRFFLASAPDLPNPSLAQFVINTRSVPAREALLARLKAIVDSGPAGGFDDIRVRVSRLELGPPVGAPVQFRIMGPDPLELRRIADAVAEAMRENPHLRNISNSWGKLAKSVRIDIDQNKARLLGLSSTDVTAVLQALKNGATVTQYREGTDLIPVLLRGAAAERQDLSGIGQIEVPTQSGQSVPLGQFAQIGYELEQPIIYRRNRTPMLLVRGDIADATQAPVVTAEVLPTLAAIKASLPEGYRIETAGTVEESAKGQDSVNAIMPLMVVVTVALLMLQLQSFSRMFMVLLTAPLGLIGVTAALLITGAPFGFVAMLGFIALSGIIMRNSVILVDQIERDIRTGLTPAQAIVEATVRRARPIALTAAAAIMALIPLALSTFWGPMAIAIMGGLLSATMLTLFVVPALYAAWVRVGRGSAAAQVALTPQAAE